MVRGAIRMAAAGALLAAVSPALMPAAVGASALPDSVVAGHRLAAEWCREYHAIEPGAVDGGKGPAFARIANMPSTTELALKVFLRSNHANMPNFIVAPADADDIVQYILSLKREP